MTVRDLINQLEDLINSAESPADCENLEVRVRYLKCGIFGKEIKVVYEAKAIEGDFVCLDLSLYEEDSKNAW